MSSQMSSQSIFFNFSRFPAEIRTIIWQLSVPDGRIVPVKYKADTSSYVARIKPPAILHATRESRHEGLKIYHEVKLGPFANTGCYVDLTRDTVYLTTDVTNKTNSITSYINSEPPYSSTYEARPIFDFFVFGQTTNIVDMKGFVRTCPFRSHSKTILNDLFESEDGRKIFTNLHVNWSTWGLMQGYCRYYRDRIPLHPKKVCLIYERGDGLLPKDIVLSDTNPDAGRPAGAAHRMACQYTASNRALNRRDENEGRKRVLVDHFEAKYLDRIDGDVGVELLATFASAGHSFRLVNEAGSES